jgi:hypothetical protein
MDRIKFALLLLLLTAVGCTPHKKMADDDPEKKDGVIKAYRKDGKLFSEITMKDGKKNGVSRNFYPNERVSLEVNYKDGKKDGLFKQFYEDGTLMKEIEYRQDRLNGLSKKFRSDGSPAWQAHFYNDMPCAGLVEYYLNGTQKKEYPSIVIEPVDRLKDFGEFILNIRLSDGSSTVTFYQGELTASGCLDREKVSEIFALKKGKCSLEYHLAPGGFVMEEIHLIAVVKTAQSNSYLITRSYNLSINN